MKILMVRHKKEMNSPEYRIEVGVVREALLDMVRVMNISPHKVNKYGQSIIDPYFKQSNNMMVLLSRVSVIIDQYADDVDDDEYTSIHTVSAKLRRRKDGFPTNI